MHLDVDITFVSNEEMFKTNPPGKRIGIIRTFHHKLYEDDGWDKKSFASKMYHYYCHEHSRSCFLIMVSLAVIITGILATVYGFILPSLYESLDSEQPQYVKAVDRKNITKYKDLFVIVGISLTSVGIVLCVFRCMFACI